MKVIDKKITLDALLNFPKLMWMPKLGEFTTFFLNPFFYVVKTIKRSGCYFEGNHIFTTGKFKSKHIHIIAREKLRWKTFSNITKELIARVFKWISDSSLTIAYRFCCPYNKLILPYCTLSRHIHPKWLLFCFVGQQRLGRT